MTHGGDRERILDQIEFYREQVRQHAPDRGSPEVQELLRSYFEDPEVRAVVRTHCPSSVRGLELASGAGRFTAPLLDVCEQITAVDSSPEMHDVNRSRHGDQRIDYVVADLFEYQPDGLYDLIFAGYWLSHVPTGYFPSFWSMLRDALAPGGRVVMVDDGVRDFEGIERFADDPTGGGERRHLANGREFTIVKEAYAPRELEACLAELDWRATVTLLTPETYVLGAQPN